MNPRYTNKSFKMLIAELLKDVEKPPAGSIIVVPFAKPELLEWIGPNNITMAYAMEPRTSKIFNRDCLASPPRYTGAYILAYPPWDRKNATENKAMFDLYGTDNLYKCFIKTLIKEYSLGGTIIVPLSFMTGTRDSDLSRRKKFLEIYQITKIHVHNKRLINTYVPLVLSFVRRTEPRPRLIEQVDVVFYPSLKQTTLQSTDDAFRNQDPFYNTIYQMPSSLKKITVSLFSPADEGVDRNPVPLYFNKTESPTLPIMLTTIKTNYRIKIRGYVSRKLTARIIADFNAWIKSWIEQTGGIFLQYVIIQEAKLDYMPTEIALTAIDHIIRSYL